MRERVTAGQLATVLHDPCHVLLSRRLEVLGQERCVEILIDALSMENNGGLLLKDGSRRRTLGGVFLELCRQRSTPDEKRKIFR